MPSSVPAAVDNLVTILKSVLPAGYSVEYAPTPVDGQSASFYLPPKSCWVNTVSGDQEPAELGINYRREEIYYIQCELTSFQGDQIFTDTMRECFDAFACVEHAITVNPWLSTTGLNDNTAAVRYAEVGNIRFDPQLTARGQCNGSLQFHVRCSQRIDSMNQ
jgi:hypothetical protein